MTHRSLNDDGTVREPVDLDQPTTPTQRAQAIVDCHLCDDDGYRGHIVCDHHDHTPAAQRGLALCRAALTRKHAATDKEGASDAPQTTPE